MGIFIFGLLVQGINNWGHGGGMLVGAALGFFLSYQERRRENLFHRVAAIICLGLTLAALLWSIVRTAMVIVAFWGG
jgi:rhomboid protease GluP